MAVSSPNPKQVNPPMQYPVSHLGSIAASCLNPGFMGSILGVTSQGVFLKTFNKWVLFISHEPYPGPLTINAPGFMDGKILLEVGMQVHFESGQLFIPDVNTCFRIQDCNPWQPDDPNYPLLSKSESQARLLHASQQISSSRKLDRFPGWPPDFILDPGRNPKKGNIFPTRNEIKASLLIDHSPDLVIKLLGAGQGLTPSGDDFVIGMFLALNRWQEILPTPPELENFNQLVVSAAYLKTSRISANLIECAVQGLADQRLINALDWLVSDNGRDSQVIQQLQNWGSSSGGDAFMGIAAALETSNHSGSKKDY